MDDKEFAECSAKIGSLAAQVVDMDLIGYLNAIEHADTIGPIIDPTLWIKGHEQMYKMKKLAENLLKFQAAVSEIVIQALEHKQGG